MSNEAVYDLAVIGGGIAGLTAATRAAQLGLRVCVLEKGDAERYLCNTRFSGGTLHICQEEIMADAAKLRTAIDAATHNSTPPALADAVATDGRRAVRWLQSVGIRFMKAGPAAYQNWMLAPPPPVRPGLEWEGRGSDVMLRALGVLLDKYGGRLMRGARAKSLLMQNGQCVGVQADSGDKSISLASAAVVIADGGFQGNAALMREHISPSPERLKQRGAGTGVGDGLLMAQAAGVRLTRLDSFYGHVLSRDAMTKDALWPHPVLDAVVTAAIAVDAQGRRFVDEGESGIYVANGIARLADPLSALAILDSAIWNSVGTRHVIPANPLIANNGGTVLQAPTIDALAVSAGLPAAELAATVRAYNDAVTQGTTAGLSPVRRSDKFAPRPIAAAPFYAIPLCAGITYTMGGIATDEHGRALDTHGAAIAGLYAAGACVGGIEGGPRAGYVGGLSKAAVMGLRSAEHLARAMGKTVL